MSATSRLDASSPAGPAGTVLVELSIPVQADLVVLARLTAATVSGRAGFGVEDIEDLRLAVEELCLSIVHDGREGRLHLTFECEPDVVTVSCRFDPPPGGAARDGGETDDLSLRILDALVDEHGRGTQDGRPSGWLRKRRMLSPA